MRLLMWNVNGIRAAYKKGFFEWFQKETPDILCVQETKARAEQLSEELTTVWGYDVYFSEAEKAGYSGVALYSKEKPNSVKYGLGIEKFDREGRIIIAEYEKFILFNIYFPNGKASLERLKYKMDFYEAFLKYTDKLKQAGKSMVICGDVNTAHKEIDLARPKENEKISGFLPEERAWMDKLVEHGFVDTFRMFNSKPDNYSWWSMRAGARKRNVGWRIDYFFVSEDLKEKVKDAFILSEVQGSDHCPIGIEIDL